MTVVLAHLGPNAAAIFGAGAGAVGSCGGGGGGGPTMVAPGLFVG